MTIEPIFTGSSGNLYLINTINNKKYLLECGLEKGRIIKGLYKRNDLISNYCGAFISHKHDDHFRSAKWINQYMPIYSNRSVMEKGLKGKILEVNQKEKFDDFVVIPFEVEHGNTENYGYVFADDKDKILFATDFYTFSANLSNIEFTQIFIECNWTTTLINEYLKDTTSADYTKYERQFNTHCGLDVLIDILDSLNLTKCKQITLVHPSKECCDQEEALIKLQTLFSNIDIKFAKNERW